MSRKAMTMHADDPLLFEFIRTVHDPDQVYAARFRPFAYPSADHPLDPTPTKSTAAFDTTRAFALIRKTVDAMFGLVPVRRATPVPCC
jgi:hypothetical protein